MAEKSWDGSLLADLVVMEGRGDTGMGRESLKQKKTEVGTREMPQWLRVLTV